jgi:hypothetical protein
MPIPSRDGAGFPIIQYVDDTITLMRASQKELLCLKGFFGIIYTIHRASNQLC